MSKYIKIYYNSLHASQQYCDPQRRWKSSKLHPFFINKETKGFNEVGAKGFLNMKKALGHGKHREQFQWSSGGVDKEAEEILRAKLKKTRCTVTSWVTGHWVSEGTCTKYSIILVLGLFASWLTHHSSAKHVVSADNDISDTPKSL